MVRRSLGLLAGGLLTIAFAAPATALAGPSVSVRIEGQADTLVARTSITLGAADIVKDGHACGGGTGAGALDGATSGSWSGPWYDEFGDFGVETVKGETYTFASGRYWAFFLNGYSAPTGLCSTTLQQGDSIVFAPIDAAGTSGLLELSGVPAAAAPGTAFTVTVKRLTTTFGGPPDYASVNAADPAPGVTVAGGGASATTDASGKATLSLTTGGPVTIRASNGADVRSAAEPVCVTDGSDGYCDTLKPATPAPAPAPSAAALDKVVPLGLLRAIGEQQRFARGRAPRELSGAVDGEASGIADIRLRLTRRTAARCERYDGARERWVRTTRCGAENGTFFSVGDRTPWSYLLPQALTKGRYVVDTQVVDKAGNATRGATRGKPGEARNRVVFFVG